MAAVRKDGRKRGWKEGWKNGWKGGRKDGWKEGRMERRVDGRKEGWLEGRKMDGWMEGRNVSKLRVQHLQATGLRLAVVAASRKKGDRNLAFLNDNRSLEQLNNATRLFVPVD